MITFFCSCLCGCFYNMHRKSEKEVEEAKGKKKKSKRNKQSQYNWRLKTFALMYSDMDITFGCHTDYVALYINTIIYIHSQSQRKYIVKLPSASTNHRELNHIFIQTHTKFVMRTEMLVATYDLRS